MRRTPILTLLAAAALVGCGHEPEMNDRGVLKYGVPPADLGRALHVKPITTEAGAVEAAAAAPAAAAPAAVRPAAAPVAPGAARPQAAPGPQPDGGPYTAMEVTGGGTVRGTVKLAKAVEVKPIKVSKEVQQCGHGDSHASERLVFDKETLGTKNCVVWLADISKGKDWSGDMAKEEDERSFLLDQKHCMYAPHVAVIREKTQLAVGNSDPTKHNIHGFRNTAAVTQFNFGTAENVTIKDDATAFLEEAAKYIVKCDIHPWMNAFIFAVKHPYYAVTDDKGAFVLENVPPGTYQVKVWHEGTTAEPVFKDAEIVDYNYGPDLTPAPKSVTVESGKDATVDFELTPP